MRNKIPRWESELWSYVSRGNTTRCPIYSQCQVRQRGGWCSSDNMDCLIQLLDVSPFRPSNYDAIGNMTPGRIFNLVEMLAESFIRKGRVNCLPVPAELLFLADEQCSIEVRLVPLTAHHGALWRLKDTWIIQLNVSDIPTTRRFTLFHEAFHILAHRRADTELHKKRGLKAGSFNELLAEYFATCILMPREYVKKQWPEAKDLQRMAKIFDVTEPVVWLRLKSLGLIQ